MRSRLPFALRVLAVPTDREDATQEILITLVMRLSDLRTPQAASAWALRIALHHLLRVRRLSALDAQRLTLRAEVQRLATTRRPAAIMRSNPSYEVHLAELVRSTVIGRGD